mmetsp:Transcript_24806/g.66296  ORF Transcript_24806/g.66296 Transcript_24806/m.66296 type:complete len:99 (+) Transcript_24806:372-668(+)
MPAFDATFNKGAACLPSAFAGGVPEGFVPALSAACAGTGGGLSPGGSAGGAPEGFVPALSAAGAGADAGGLGPASGTAVLGAAVVAGALASAPGAFGP